MKLVFEFQKVVIPFAYLCCGWSVKLIDVIKFFEIWSLSYNPEISQINWTINDLIFGL